ncbi:MAG TPA: hypothetical protein VJ044_09710 [Candidatus Hodarchaeales archaeon]|nr:hypothetical protein [Candidatus Hodarchaeales archaeon]
MTSKEILQEILGEKDLRQWKRIVSDVEGQSAIDLAQFLTEFLKTGVDYFRFGQVLWEATDAKGKYDVLAVWIEGISRTDETFARFLHDLLTLRGQSIDYELFEYFLDLLRAFRFNNRDDKNEEFSKSSFFSIFLYSPDRIIATASQLIAANEGQLDDFPSTDTLMQYVHYPERLQIDMLTQIFREPISEGRKTWIRVQLERNYHLLSEKTRAGFVTHVLDKIDYLPPLIEEISLCLREEQSSFVRETVMLYLLPVEIATNSLIHPILEYFFENLPTKVLESLGPIIADWPVNLQSKLMTLAENHPESAVRSALMKIMSERWFSERILLQGMRDPSEEVQEAAIRTAIAFYSELGVQGKKELRTLLEPLNGPWPEYYGLLVGHNFDQREFAGQNELLTKSVSGDSLAERRAQECIIGMVLRWEDLPDTKRKELSTLLSSTRDILLKELVLEVFQAYTGNLGEEGHLLLEYLSRKESFLDFS